MSYYSLKNKIKLNEGFSIKPYKDQLGFLTIGYGHLVLPSEKNLLKNNIKKKELEKIFEKDFNKALNDFKNFLEPITSNKKEAELLIEIIFQIGIKGTLKFKNLLTNIRKSNKYSVCFEMMDSLWYKQTPHRVKALVNSFLNNER